MLKFKALAASLFIMLGASSAQAALVDLGDGTVLDNTTNLIWLQNWNVNGNATWPAQLGWADNLSFAGSTAWALPSIDEYTTLFNEVGDLRFVPQFNNVTPNFYWSRTEGVPGITAFGFGIGTGALFEATAALQALPAVAVRPADVAAVPEPQTLALMLLGLSAFVVSRRVRRG